MKPRILIVEDEPAIMDTIQYALETDGFETICLTSGISVIPMLAQNPIDLIILDIGLPDISGIELCKQIRKDSDIPIIFLTARADEVDRVVGLEIGADDYVTKPFSPRELAARVKAVLRRTNSREKMPSHTETQALKVDDSRRRITCFGKDLDLSRYEFDLLRTLIRLPGHVFSRDRLMDLVWDDPAASMDRTVDAHIKTIRAKIKKIKKDFHPIITHRGIGYALKEEI